jgi:hypothetical protein
MYRPGLAGACASEPLELSDSNDGEAIAPAKAMRHAVARASQTVAADTRPPCQYGSNCYRTNPQHRAAYRHNDIPRQPAPRARQTSRYFDAAPALNGPSSTGGVAGLIDLISDEDD